MITRFVCAGSLNIDLTFPVERLPEQHEKLRCRESILDCGGSAANTAYWLAKLKQPVHMLGCVGDDPFGAFAVAALAKAGVDTRLIQRTRQSVTGVAAIFATFGSKRMVTSGGANAYFNPAEVDSGVFGPGVHVHLATPRYEPALRLIGMAKERGATVSCDLDEGPSVEMIPQLDWVFMNHTALRRWTGSNDPSKARKLLSPSTVLIVTQGARGAVALGPAGEYVRPAYPTTVIDRTGGGDAFVAGFLYGLAQGGAPEPCLQLGLLLAAQVIAHPGSRPCTIDAETILGSVLRSS